MINVSENVNGHVYILQDIKCLTTHREFKDLSSIVHTVNIKHQVIIPAP